MLNYSNIYIYTRNFWNASKWHDRLHYKKKESLKQTS